MCNERFKLTRAAYGGRVRVGSRPIDLPTAFCALACKTPVSPCEAARHCGLAELNPPRSSPPIATLDGVRILVTGATGYVGSRLVTELLAASHHVVAASRNPARLRRLGWLGDVTAVELDAADRAAAHKVFTDAGQVDVVYYTNLAAAAKDAGARRIVCLGGFVPDSDDLSQHLVSRAEVAAALTVEDGPEVVWLGAAIILGAGSTSFEMLGYVGDRFPLMPMPAWMDHPIDPISIRDVLYHLIAAADAGQVPPGAYDICGPDTTVASRLTQWRYRFPTAWPPIWWNRWPTRCSPPTPACGAGLLTRPAGWWASTTPLRWRCRARGPGPSTRWPIRTTSLRATRRGPAATPYASASSRGPSHHGSRTPRWAW